MRLRLSVEEVHKKQRPVHIGNRPDYAKEEMQDVELTMNIVVTRMESMMRKKLYSETYGADAAFVCASFAVCARSTTMADKVIEVLVSPLILVLRTSKAIPFPSTMAIMLLSSLVLLKKMTLVNQCIPFLLSRDCNSDAFDQLKVPANVSYEDLLVFSVTCYFQSFVLHAIPGLELLRSSLPLNVTAVTARVVVRVVCGIVRDRWQEIKAPLQFTRKKLLVQSNLQRRRLYFLTHVLFIGNHYGTQPLDPEYFPPKFQARLYAVFVSWFHQFVAADAVFQNIEEFCEVSSCVLYLSKSLRCTSMVPDEIFQVAMQLSSKRELLYSQAGRRRHTWYPIDGHLYDIYTDTHTLLVVTTLLVDVAGYIEHRRVLQTLQNEPVSSIADTNVLLRVDQHTSTNLNYQQLILEGYVFLPAHASTDSRWCHPLQAITNSLQNIYNTDRHTMYDVLIRVPPAPEQVDVFIPKNPTCAQKKTLVSVEIPPRFWQDLQDRLSRALGINRSRVLILRDETYMRMKVGPSALTNAHADFFYFVNNTDVFARINPLYGKMPQDHGRCQLCMNEPGKKCTKMMFGRKCANGYIPVYTAWVSLGQYTPGEHSLLEVVPRSHLLNGYDKALTGKKTASELPPGRLPRNSWIYPRARGVTTCDIIVFNCKTIHRARPAKTSSPIPRFSVDARFIIMPDE